MKRVCVVAMFVLCFPLAALAQTPRRPAPPPVPPTPPAAPVVAVPPVLDPVDIVMPDVLASVQIDVERIADEARRLSEELAYQDKPVVTIDKDAITAEVKARTEELKAQAERFKEEAKDRAKVWTEDFNYQMQIHGPAGLMIARSGDAYNSGLSYLSRRQYDQAIVRFDQVIAQKGAHTDGALYWKAYSQYKLGKTEDTLATLAELRKSYAQSHYVDDARVLEADARKTSGKPLTGDADNDEIKLLAISSMQNSNPEGAVSLLENVLKSTNSLSVKKRALFVLANNDQPAAHQLLMSYAKGKGNPDLQIEAIRYLTARRAGTTSAELEEIYNSTQDVDVRRAVLEALVSTGDRAAVLRIAGTGTAPIELRRSAISNLSRGSLANPAELMQLYQKEENKDLKQTMLRAFGSMGAADQLIQIIKTEKDPALRQQAIRSLGSIRSDKSGQTLVDLYGSEQDKDVRKAVISALSNQNNAEGLVSIARKETSGDLKIEIVRRIADIAPKNKVAMDFLLEQIK